MRVFKVTDNVFKTEPLFVIDCKFEIFRRYMKRRFRQDVGEYIGQCGQMFTFERRPPFRVVWAASREPGIVMHETFHLVTRICQDKGIPIRAQFEHNENGDEAAAYLFEFFSRAVLRHLR